MSVDVDLGLTETADVMWADAFWYNSSVTAKALGIGWRPFLRDAAKAMDEQVSRNNVEAVG